MVYFQVTVHLKDSQQARFFELMPQFAKLAAAEIDFRLSAAYIPATGRQNTYIHIWAVPDANAVQDLPRELPKHPELAAVYAQVKECIADEAYELLVAAPYAG